MAPGRYAHIFPAFTLDIVALFVTPYRSFTDNTLGSTWALQQAVVAPVGIIIIRNSGRGGTSRAEAGVRRVTDIGTATEETGIPFTSMFILAFALHCAPTDWLIGGLVEKLDSGAWHTACWRTAVEAAISLPQQASRH